MGWFRKWNERPSGPDFSQIDSREKVLGLARQGDLVPLLMIPEIFGGDDQEANLLFVPPFAAELKKSFDENVVKPLAVDRKITRYRAEPVYSGNSFVPVAITIHAHDPAEVHHRIAIWGEALG